MVEALDGQIVDPGARRVPIPLHVDHVHTEPIQREVQANLEESVCALGESMDYAHRALVGTNLGGVHDIGQVAVHVVVLVCLAPLVVAIDLELAGQGDLSFVKCLKRVQAHFHVVNVVDGHLCGALSLDLLLDLEIMCLVLLEYLLD